MAREQPTLKSVLNEIARSGDRSSLFWWMVEHHDELVTAANGRRMQWRAFCARLRDLGLTDRTGKPASAKVARLTWFRARQEVARARGATAARPARSSYPSRMPKDWKPEAFRPQPSGPGTGSSFTPGIHSPGTALVRKPSSQAVVPLSEREVEEKMADLRRQLRERSV
jgi:hypothetical protein